jgi:hypothetical protein
MAFSKTKEQDQLLGGLHVLVFNLNFASVTSGQFKTGLNKVIFAAFNNDVTEDQGLVKLNKDSAGTGTENGSIYISSVTSNDTGTLIVIGR